ncbi:hypothetical protein, partial [Litoribaculum gwangyangense]|uniref:hypothetical protein n=1 Tax=Litoribaculum gwangyangense TaxID=1130722 RepID=UPI0031ECAC64
NSLQFAIFRTWRIIIADFPQRAIHKTVGQHTKSPPHKQHIWFLPTRKPTLKKPKELFFANARQKDIKKVNFIPNMLISLRKTKTS